MWRFLKLLIGTALWPLAWAVSASTYLLYQTSLDASLEGRWSDWSLPLGFLAWVILFFLLPRPFRTYVLGHELTHALWAVLMGGRVGRMKIGPNGGHVELTRTNFIITLAPYFFPFYTVLVIVAYHIAGIWLDVKAWQVWWPAAVGFTWSFHITFTIHMLSQQQPDVHEHGRIFSLTVIYIMNVLVIALLMVMLGESRLLRFGDLLRDETAAAYGFAAHMISRGWVQAARLIRSIG